jgi:hypothetical protein
VTAVLILLAQVAGDLTGASPYSAGMAGAGGAAPAGPLDATRNPALLPWLFASEGRSRLLDVSVRAIGAEIDARDRHGADLAIEPDAAIGPWLAYAARAGEDVFWSFAVQPIVGGSSSGTRTTQLDIVTRNLDGSGGPAPHDVRVASELLQVALEPSLGWRAGRAWTFGLGLSLRDTQIELASANAIDLAELNGPIDPGLEPIFGDISWGELILMLGEDRGVETFQAEFDAEADSSRPQLFLQFGGTWQPADSTRVAFWYRPPSTRADLEGRVDVDLGADLGTFVNAVGEVLGEVLLEDPRSGYDFRIPGVRLPQQAGVAALRDLGGGRRLHATALWTDWSRTFSGWTAELSNPSNPEFLEYLGGDGSTEVNLDLEWRDSVAVSLGCEQDLGARWTPRAGAAWSRNPVDGSVLTGLAPFNRWHVGAGATRWGRDGGPMDWHLGVVIALPQDYQSGRSEELEDWSFDEIEQWVWSVGIGCVIAW